MPSMALSLPLPFPARPHCILSASTTTSLLLPPTITPSSSSYSRPLRKTTTTTPLHLPIPMTTTTRRRSSKIRRRATNAKPTATTINATAASPSSGASRKIARFRALDRVAAKHSRLRFVRKLKTLLLSKPRHFLPLRLLSRHCRPYLSLHHNRHHRPTLLSMILRYPAIFRLFHAASLSSHSFSLLSVGLTPAAAALAAEESRLRDKISSSLAAKLQKLLMLSHGRQLLLSKLVHLAPDLGLPTNFRSRLCNSHPNLFRTLDTSLGRALELVSWDPSLAVPLPVPPPPKFNQLIIDRPLKFSQLKLRKGLNLKRRHRDYLIRLQELPDVSPYASSSSYESPEMAEKRACAVVREVLGMAVEMRTLVDHLTHLRKDLGLPNKLRGLLVRHPEMFYVSLKGQRDSVFLVEGYDDKGKLLQEDGLVAAKERLLELVREGKKMRRERRKNDASDDDDDSEDDDDDAIDGDDEGDFLEDLFDSGICDDWEDLLSADGDANVDTDGGDMSSWGRNEEEEMLREFWSLKAPITESTGGHGAELEVW